MTKPKPSSLAGLFALVLSAMLCSGAAMASSLVSSGVSVATTGKAKFSATPVSERSRARRVVKPRQLVIFLHGIGGRGAVMEGIGEGWKSTLPDTRFVSPDAPFRHMRGGREWFVVDDFVMQPERIEAARRAFDVEIAKILKREGFENDLANVAFVGVSQGAIMALDAVSSGRWKVGTVVSIAGLLPLPPVPSANESAILLLHGADDRTIPSSAAMAARTQLQAAGFDVTTTIYPGLGHTISSGEKSEALQFLRSRFDETADLN